MREGKINCVKSSTSRLLTQFIKIKEENGELGHPSREHPGKQDPDKAGANSSFQGKTGMPVNHTKG